MNGWYDERDTNLSAEIRECGGCISGENDWLSWDKMVVGSWKDQRIGAENREQNHRLQLPVKRNLARLTKLKQKIHETRLTRKDEYTYLIISNEHYKLCDIRIFPRALKDFDGEPLTTVGSHSGKLERPGVCVSAATCRGSRNCRCLGKGTSGTGKCNN
jgi:hypothetical protein